MVQLQASLENDYAEKGKGEIADPVFQALSSGSPYGVSSPAKEQKATFSA